MNIQVTIKNVYGRETIYPACEKSKILAKLSGCTTLTSQAVAYIKALGYAITVKQDVVSL